MSAHLACDPVVVALDLVPAVGPLLNDECQRCGTFVIIEHPYEARRSGFCRSCPNPRDAHGSEVDPWGRPVLTRAHSAWDCNDRACTVHPDSLYGTR